MRKIILLLLGFLSLALLAIFILSGSREKRYPEVNFSTLNEAETSWYNAGLLHYHMIVDVEFSSERRRHDLTIQNGQVSQAAISYWEDNSWSQPNAINAEQASLYTIPGLFNMLREELNRQMREEIRMDINPDPAYPRYIYLGKVWLEGEPMEESEAHFTIRAFEILTP